MDNINAKATALPVTGGISSTLKAIIGTGIAYAGYKATKKQTEEIGKDVQSILNAYVDEASKATYDDLIDKDAYNAWLGYQWINHPFKSALREFSQKIYECTAEKMEEKKEELRFELIEGGKKDPDNEPESNPNIDAAVNAALGKWVYDKYNKNVKALDNLANNKAINSDNDLINNGIGAAAAAQVSISFGLTSAMSKLVSEVVKQNYNAEYEKTKSKYDWQTLGFKTDYDVLPSVDISYLKSVVPFAVTLNTNVDNKTVMVTELSPNTHLNCRNQLFIFDKIQNDSLYGQSENHALITLRDYKTEKWNTYCASEYYLFQIMSDYKNNYIDYDDLLAKLKITSSNATVTQWQFYQNATYADYSNQYSRVLNSYDNSSPFTMHYYYGNGFNYGGSLPLLGSVKIVNPSKTMNYFFINFADENTYQGSCSTENGTIQPTVKKSVYTNTADEINSKPNITIDTNKTYDNTDEQIEDIAQDNDLNLEVIEDNTEEITDNTKGIWETVKSILSSIVSLPRKMYNSFSGILNKILNAVKANPLEFFNYIANPLTAIENAVKNGVKEIIKNMPPGITNIMPDSLINILDKMDLNLSTAAMKLIDIAGTSAGVSTIGQIGSLLNLIESIAGDTVLGDIVAAINNSPVSGVLRAIENLPNKLSLGNIVTAISNLPVSDVLRAIENLPNKLSFGNISSTVGSIYTSVESLAGNISDSVKNVLTSLFIPDTAVINNALSDLKGNFAFVNDFRNIVSSIINTAIEPHDYITIHNWNKSANKYDQRDRYRISFSWYAPYRPYVNAIIIALVYLFFIWRIFIKLPSIISGTGGGIDTIFSAAQTYNDLNNKGGD